VAAQLGPEGIVDLVGIASGPFSEFKSSFFRIGEIGTVAKFSKFFELLVAPSVPPCQGGVGRQSIFAAVDLRGADDYQFLQLGGNGASVHHCTEMRDHGPEDLRPMRYGAEHVGDVAAFLEIGVVDLAGFGIDLVLSRRVIRDRN
jgi:hypothetical protein